MQCQFTAGGVRKRPGARRTPSAAALRGSGLVCGGGRFWGRGPGEDGLNELSCQPGARKGIFREEILRR